MVHWGIYQTRKLIISLYRLDKAGLLENDTCIIGVDLHVKDNSKFVKVAQNSLKKYLNEEVDKAVWDKFSARLTYLQIDPDSNGAI